MSKTIYVGRIPFDYTEEQVRSIFQSAGPIQDIRFVFDKETGKSKGFAFVEYFDAEAAASAVRNLDNHKVGNMKLKVDFSNEGGSSAQPGQSAFEYIAMFVNEMSPDEKRQLITDFKGFTVNSRTQALELLQQSPQIAYALVQAMIETGKIDQKIADTLLPAGPQQQSKERGGRGRPKKQNKPAARANSSRQNTPQPPVPVAPAAPAAAAPPSEAMETAASHPTPQNPEETAMIRQVMALTDAQVASLPPDQRQMVLDIKAKVQRGDIRL